MNPLPIVWADCRRATTGILSVVCLIAIAVALGVAVSAQERALRTGSARAADAFDLLIGAPGSQTQLVLTAVYLQPAALPLLPGEVLKRLQTEARAAYAAPIAFGDSYLGYPVVGSTADFLTQGGRIAPREGRIFQEIHEVVVGSDVRLQMGGRFTPVHGQTRAEVHDDDEDEAEHRHEGVKYTVVGRLPRSGTPWDRAIVAPVEAVWRIHGLGTGHKEGGSRIGPPWTDPELPGVPAIVVKPKSVADAYTLRATFRVGGTMAVFPAEVLVEIYALLGDARDLLATFSVATQALVIAAVLLAVFATLTMRRRQFAVLRALGASRGYIFLVVWTHVSLLIAAGTALGLLLGWAGAYVVSWFLSKHSGIALPVALGAPEIGMALALIGIGCILAAIPSWSSYRQPVSANLRS
jgi:putative ABC transport system permease protein